MHSGMLAFVDVVVLMLSKIFHLIDLIQVIYMTDYLLQTHKIEKVLYKLKIQLKIMEMKWKGTMRELLI